MSAVQALKYAAIRAGLEGISLLGPLGLKTGARGRGVIFTLHHVRPNHGHAFDPNGILSVTPQFLEQAIEAALECGLVPVAAEDLPALLADPADGRLFVSFTLDDGYRNNAEFAAPVFTKYDVPFTIFITGGFVERSRSLWWETAEALIRDATELRFDFGSGPETLTLRTTRQKLAAFERFSRFIATHDEDEAIAKLDALALAHGVDPLGITAALTMEAAELRALAMNPLARFGAHTLTHPNMRRLDDARLHDEITQSAEAVKRYIGRAPRIFAYPYGFREAVGDREIKAVAEAGFAIAVTTQPGVLSAANLESASAFPRVSLNGAYQKKRYVKALISGLPFRFL
jgi:peptidoglycan/xylan/chitin deacetylase (PgdA/CDA1 family)